MNQNKQGIVTSIKDPHYLVQLQDDTMVIFSLIKQLICLPNEVVPVCRQQYKFSSSSNDCYFTSINVNNSTISSSSNNNNHSNNHY